MLNQLQRMGAIPTKYKEVDFSTCRIVTECGEEIPDNVAIVIDGCTWAATARGIPTETAPTVYSGDAEGNVGVFTQRTLRFSKKVLDGNTLRTVHERFFKIKEEMNMNMNFNVDPTKLQEQLSSAQIIPAATFNDAAPTASVSKSAGKGTLISFITKTNSTVKAALKDPTAVGPDGKQIKGTHDPAQIVFKNAAPGQIVGGIVKMNLADGGQVVKVLDKDETQVLMARKFNGVLSEDESILGRGNASMITLKCTAAKGQNAPANGIRTSFALKSRLGRSTVLTEGNYLPLRVFKTGSISEQLQANVMKLFAGKRSIEELAPDYQDAVAGGVVNQAKLTALNAFKIPCYNNKKVTMDKPVLPVVEKYVAKSGADAYRFKYESDLTAILQSKAYTPIVNATGLGIQDLATQLTTKFTKRKNVITEFDVDEFLAAVQEGRVLNGKKDANGMAGTVDFDQVMLGLEGIN